MTTRPLISAAMIVRDEEHFLEECLASIGSFVDDIVIVDTGSTDKSIAIAEGHGARVLHRQWDGDFAAARNAALDAATGEWILYIDADERVRPVDREELHTLLRNAEEVAFGVVFHPFVDSTPYFEQRLWRNDSRIRFRGVIHEKHTGAIAAVSEADGRPIGRCPMVVIDHVGYEGNQTAKHFRNIPLLEAQLQEEPENIFNWTHLGRAWADLGHEHNAKRAFENAINLERLQPEATEQGVAAYAELARIRHAAGEDVADVIAEGLARFPDNWMLVWLGGHLALEAGRDEEAAESFRRLVAVDIDSLAEVGVAYDARIFGVWAQASLGLACFRLGLFDEAAAAYRAAETYEPDNEEWTVKRRLAEARAGRS